MSFALSSGLANMFASNNSKSSSDKSSAFTKPIYQNVMLDLETLGTTPGSVILSIAAVHFTMSGEVTTKFFQKIDIQSCLDAGLTVSGSTINWWMSQSYDARQSSFGDDAESLSTVLDNLSKFFKSVGDFKFVRVWGNSSDFDCAILGSAYEKCKIPVPWKFWNTRCVRTISSLYPSIKNSMVFEGEKHNPLDDCIHQIRYLTKVIQIIDKDLAKYV